MQAHIEDIWKKMWKNITKVPKSAFVGASLPFCALHTARFP
jgi:hypothetical protein